MRYILKAAVASVLATTLWATMASATSASVTLHWTAPGDDSLTGRATMYDLRYSLNAITASDFASAARWTSMTAPLPAGSKETCTVSGLLPSTIYRFALKTGDDAGNWSMMSNVALLSSATVVGVDDPAAPTALQFSAPQPNPARSSTAFTLGLPSTQDVQVVAYDVQGRMVKTLFSGTHPAGQLRLSWNLDNSNGQRLSTGVYLVHARIGTESFERRVAIVR